MSDDLTRCPCCEGEGYFYGDETPPSPYGDADEITRLRAEVERRRIERDQATAKAGAMREVAASERAKAEALRAALADERAHADALVEALKATAACLDMLPATAIACGANETAIGTAKSAEDYSETLDCAVSAIDLHRARRQG